MARTVGQYRDMLLLLLPRGDVWRAESDSALHKIATAVGAEYRRIEQFAENLVEESDPRTVVDLIGEWETDWGLPTDCTGPLTTLTERRNALVNRIVGIADQSRQTYIDRAAQVGYTITITEYVAGDSVPGLPAMPVADAAYAVQINAPLNSIQYRQCGQPHGELFAAWGNELLECTLNEISLAHHTLLFSYT